jgi:four helix bundle protein
MDLAESVYLITENFPKSETYGLQSQIRRAAVSIPSNIAEGKGRGSDRDLTNFLCYARGSCHELETQFLLAQRLRYLSNDELAKVPAQCDEIGRMINGLIRAFRK